MWRKLLITTLYLAVYLAAAPTSYADKSFPSSRTPGAATKQWLQMQSSAEQASSSVQSLSGPVSTTIYQRYKDSFNHPIPEKFTSKDSGSTSK